MILKQYIESWGAEQNHHRDPKNSFHAKVEDEMDAYPLHSWWLGWTKNRFWRKNSEQWELYMQVLETLFRMAAGSLCMTIPLPILPWQWSISTWIVAWWRLTTHHRKLTLFQSPFFYSLEWKPPSKKDPRSLRTSKIRYLPNWMPFVCMPLRTVSHNFQKGVWSVLQSREITSKENKRMSFLLYMHLFTLTKSRNFVSRCCMCKTQGTNITYINKFHCNLRGPQHMSCVHIVWTIIICYDGWSTGWVS